jgi:MFS family permease
MEGNDLTGTATHIHIGAARLAVLTLFFINGLAGASWFVRIPDVQDSIGLSNALLGVTLLGLPAGAVVAMPIAGLMTNRVGSRRIALIGAVIACVGVALIGVANNAALLAAMLVVFGIGNGAMDIGMNAQGVEVESYAEHSLMSQFHGAFSVGGIAGAASGGFLASHGVDVQPHLAGIGLICFIATLVIARLLLPRAAEHEHADAPALTLRAPWPIVLLGIIAFCAMLTEGAMSDWTAVYLRDIGAGAGLAASGYALFSITMAIGRLSGDRAIDALGGRRLIRIGGVVAAGGILLAMVLHTVPAALIGFGLVGIGVATIAPIVYSTAGRSRLIPPGTAIAAATTIGYLGFMAGPPVIGLTAGLTGLRWALTVVVAMLGAMVMLARSIEH